MRKARFSFEDLEVWQKSLEFANRIIKLSEHLKTDKKHYRLIDQIESSATSISMNIAEGKGRYSKREFIQFLYIARGSLFEAVTLLMIFYKNGWIDEEQLDDAKSFADEIGKMIAGLIASIKRSVG